MAKYQITTPEQVLFHYDIVGPFSRCMAWLIDEAMIWTGYILFILAAQWIVGSFVSSASSPEEAQRTALWEQALILLGIFVLDFSYFTFCELRRGGQTPGKRVMGIRVISARGARLRFSDVLIRNLMRPIDMLPYFMLVGGTACFLDRWHRRLGDMVADTILIRSAHRELPQAMAAEKSRVNSFQADPAIRTRILTRVGRSERDLILDLAIRRDQIDPDIRRDLFAKAAGHFRTALNLPADVDYLSDEQTVINLAMVIQDAKFTA